MENIKPFSSAPKNIEATFELIAICNYQTTIPNNHKINPAQSV